MSSFAEQLQATKRNKATTANGGYPATFSSEDVRDITNELSHMYSKDSAYETKESVHIANSGAFHSSNDGHDGHAPHPTTKADSGLSNSSVDRQERIESTRSQNSQNEDLTREDSRVKLRSKVSNIQNPVRNTASGFKDHYRNRESLTMASNIYASKYVVIRSG
ncbi:hypothetical protein SARC_00166 [Sphaeroforma arctica JP610]|uniref:Uncharacterized protein n=1 Tax=Sphaeroforma arctica JP610 TaxID=667725 RepID=A0A0L0GFD3_9EUKA|nr:hypothetical protein SARC_00166 [Sphaeroforma arctica JP610]KNC87732.1 hypothetical protein SARC_00166 [Sphaeroforma arctica JP610]|eukprot:XP_014161634.1 hypothetical protein SARC_00166 [Sphaeroforma arctica JP610]